MSLRTKRALWVVESTRSDGSIGPVVGKPIGDVVFEQRREGVAASRRFCREDRAAQCDTEIRVTRYEARVGK